MRKTRYLCLSVAISSLFLAISSVNATALRDVAPQITAAAQVNEAFDLWQECTTHCQLDLSQGVRSSELDLTPLFDTSNEEGILHYSMLLGEGNEGLKLAIDNALTLHTTLSTINFTSKTAGSGPRSYTYHRQGENNWSLNWLVPVGDDAPASIKIFFLEQDAVGLNRYISPIYSIEVSNNLLNSLASKSTLYIRAFDNNQTLPTLNISRAGVSYVAAPLQHHRQKRWSEWHTGKLLCFLDPFDAFYNYVTQHTCNPNDTWEGQIYRVLAGNPATLDTTAPSTTPAVISHRIHFDSGNSLASLTAHQVCGIPLESLARTRHSRGWEELNNCGYPVRNLVSLFILARLSWDRVEQVIHNALTNPTPGNALDDAIREAPERARVTLTLAAAQVNQFDHQAAGNTPEQAQSADVVSLSCSAGALHCSAPADSANALLEREHPNGATFLGAGEAVSFTTRGTRNWSSARLNHAHQQLIARGYVFVGYHGSSLEGAQSIVFGGIRTRTQALDDVWQGLYISGDPAVAYGYAQDQEPDSRGRIRNGTMLRVYVPGTAIAYLYETSLTLADPDAVDAVGHLIGHPLPLQTEAITGPEEAGGRPETILGWELAEQAVAIPSTIATDPSNIGGDLDPLSIPDEESDISALPDYVTKPYHDEL